MHIRSHACTHNGSRAEWRADLIENVQISVDKFLKQRKKDSSSVGDNEWQWEYSGTRNGFWLYDDEANASMVRHHCCDDVLVILLSL